MSDTQDSGERVRPSPAAWLLLGPVHVYRKIISPLLPPTCRFYPSCSAYAVEALTVHGALYGSWLTVRRLLRCGPWHPGGFDYVPSRRGRAGGPAAEPGEAPRPPAED
ncbi:MULTISPECIES: membrane protein insertion efficiency factor YidD [unclassified Saccharopolyspora]|uniref:membrane protein insertion efficiency factor YidD n=1 Tax=unclassified Saccharopolyspora TaxID=2646250 RepID=UPI001CD6F3B6|nr:MULTISPECIES: membrane protein insertion efficiency factor YidD [unclassified Saccharopolyspora]MCA1187962.1 membrane protein insertion efficiency factor YidD [Saccharopolyspora sp. 6T]MCA1191822.1 membrane protein insertion efficiency factor YidD [Saccharopolyspora sp. 6V]MCA1226031.1 membrane protein insertion efficiency factor YidD [Saccharopolyspora sp. 6M]MCA1281668.1 membrane protein insertion efficiency factor YidD [Saccharopolyspora sp. 7B]